MGMSIKGKTSGHMSDKSAKSGNGKSDYGKSRSDQGKKTSYAARVAAASSAEKGSPTQGNRSNERGRDN